MREELLLLKCPACHTRFQGDESPDDPCRRCRTDLRSLRLCYQHARLLCQKVRIALLKQQATQALWLAKRARALVEHPITTKLFACAFYAYRAQQKTVGTFPTQGEGSEEIGRAHV